MIFLEFGFSQIQHILAGTGKKNGKSLMEGRTAEEHSGGQHGSGEEKKKRSKKVVRRKETVGRKEELKENRNWGRNGDMHLCQRKCMTTIQRSHREELERLWSGKL